MSMSHVLAEAALIVMILIIGACAFILIRYPAPPPEERAEDDRCPGQHPGGMDP